MDRRIAHLRRTLLLLATAALAVGVAAGVACGDAPLTVHHDAEHRVSLRYDDDAFTADAPLAGEESLRRAHAAVGFEPVAVVSFADPDSAAVGEGHSDGFRLAVFDAPAEMRTFGLWRLGDQVIPRVMPDIREALGPGSEVSDPDRLEYGGMKGYGLTFALDVDGTRVKGYWFVFVRYPYAYELIVHAAADRFDDRQEELLAPFWTLRTGDEAEPGDD